MYALTSIISLVHILATPHTGRDYKIVRSLSVPGKRPKSSL